MTLMEDVKYGLFIAVSIFGDFREVLAKIKPTQKIPNIRYVESSRNVYDRPEVPQSPDARLS